MNAQTNDLPVIKLGNSPGIDAFHRERSKCIDAFSNIEENVISLLGKLGEKSGNEPFSQKLNTLRNSKGNAAFQASRIEALQKLLPRCEALSCIRNDIVHSRLELVDMQGGHKACFINVGLCQQGGQMARLFSLEALRRLRSDISRLADELSQI